MVISILGIVFLQGYWIYSSWETKEEEFSLTVSQSLQNVATEIQEREINDYLIAFDSLLTRWDVLMIQILQIFSSF